MDASEMHRVLYSIPDACEQLGGMGRSTFYQEVGKGRIAVVKIGSRTFVARSEIERYVGALVAGSEVSVPLKGV